MTADQREQTLAAFRRVLHGVSDGYTEAQYVNDQETVRTALTPAPLPADLAEIQARADAATPGPWHADAGEDDSDLIPHFGPDGELYIVHGSGWDDDAVFIAHARTDVPALVAELAELRARPTLTAEEARLVLDATPATADEAEPGWDKIRAIAESTNHDNEPHDGSEGATS